MVRALAALFAAFLLIAPAWAVQPDEMLKDPVLEQRARNLSSGLRCLVCQNQSIDESDAPLAKDLRVLVRDRLKSGDTDEQVMDYVVQRYGEFVLLRPVFGTHTLLLWLAPLVILVFGGLGLLAALRRRPSQSSSELSNDEQRALDRLLEENRPSESA